MYMANYCAIFGRKRGGKRVHGPEMCVDSRREERLHGHRKRSVAEISQQVTKVKPPAVVKGQIDSRLQWSKVKLDSPGLDRS